MDNLSEIASNYSSALISSCADKNEVERICEELNSFVEFCNSDNKIKSYISNLFYDIHERKAIVKEICSLLKISKLGEDFIHICFINSRIDSIGVIISDLKSRLDIMNNTKRAEIFSSNLLNKSEIGHIKEILDKKFSANFIVDNKLDSSLMGGIKISFDNKIIDISISGILQYYKNFLIKES